MKEKIYLYVRWVGIKVYLINHHFKLEFINSGLYFVQDENNFINPLLQVGSGSGFNEKSTGFGGQEINGSDRIRILIPGNMKKHLLLINILTSMFLSLILTISSSSTK